MNIREIYILFWRILYIVALERKPANSQGDFTGQRKKQTKFNIVVMERNYFSHFFSITYDRNFK